MNVMIGDVFGSGYGDFFQVIDMDKWGVRVRPIMGKKTFRPDGSFLKDVPIKDAFCDDMWLSEEQCRNGIHCTVSDFSPDRTRPQIRVHEGYDVYLVRR